MTWHRFMSCNVTGVLIPTTEFVQIDTDGYAEGWLWITNSAHTQVNTTAAFLNRVLFGVMMFHHGILRDGVFLPKDAAVAAYIRQHVDALMYYNENTLQSIEDPFAFEHRHVLFARWGHDMNVWKNSDRNVAIRATKPFKEYSLMKWVNENNFI